MKGILFVCLGNICRSPMAEVIGQQMLVERKLDDRFFCDSAGTSAYHIGAPPDIRTRSVLAKHGMRTKHLGRQVGVQDFERFTYIFAMDRSNYNNLLDICPPGKEVLMLRDYDTQGRGKDVPDPYNDDERGFDLTYEMLTRSIAEFLDSVPA